MAHLDIVDLAESLLADTHKGSVKVASADLLPNAPAHPVTQALKHAAEALRRAQDDALEIADVQKVAQAMQPGTGAQAPAAGGATTATPPKLPSLQTSNLGVVAGGGGAGESLKVGSEISQELRKLAGSLRHLEDVAAHRKTVKAACVLSAVTGLQHLQNAVQGLETEKVALSLPTILGAVEHGAASRTPEQLGGILERAAGRQARAQDLYRSLPAGDPREALALKRLGDNTALSTMTGGVQDELASAIERQRAMAPAPAPSPVTAADDFVVPVKPRGEIAGAPTAAPPGRKKVASSLPLSYSSSRSPL